MSFKCEKCGNIAQYEHKNIIYCNECLLKELKIKKYPKISYTYEYNDGFYGTIGLLDDEFLNNVNINYRKLNSDIFISSENTSLNIEFFIKSIVSHCKNQIDSGNCDCGLCGIWNWEVAPYNWDLDVFGKNE